MSKFAEKLQRVYRGQTTAIGFRRTGEEEIPQMLVVANLIDASAKSTRATAGADAVLVSGGNISSEELKQLADALGDIPVGVTLDSGVSQTADKGCDFVVFDIKTPVGMINKEGLGKILKIEPSLDVGMVRAINGLPLSVDGVLIGGEDSTLTVERLLVCQRFADLIDKPLLLALGSPVTSGDLSSLCETGVKGIVVSSAVTAKAITDLKKAISCLPKPARRRIKSTPIIPSIRPEPVVEEEEEEEE